MKKGLHPESYRPVVFKDMSNGDMFLSRSTVATKETIEFADKTPLNELFNKAVPTEETEDWLYPSLFRPDDF